MSKKEYDFSGYATRNNRRCGDGRVILKDAFKDCDGETVPLVWHHQHSGPDNVLGHAVLENRDDGVYCYCSFNKTPNGEIAKEVVKHGDVKALSIYANRLKQRGSDVVHGVIREVSLVLAGANPGAYIDNLALAHDGIEDIIDDEAIIKFVEDDYVSLIHEEGDDMDQEANENAKNKSVLDVFDEAMDSLSEEQRQAVYMVLEAIADEDNEGDKDDKNNQDKEEPVDRKTQNKESEDQEDDESMEHDGMILSKEEERVALSVLKAVIDDDELSHADAEAFDNFSDFQKSIVYDAVDELTNELAHQDNEGEDMKFNVFDEATGTESYLSHDDMASIFDDAKKIGSLKDAVLAHGIQNIEVLFPEAQAVNNTPLTIARKMDWVSKVLSGTHKTPFSRIKATAANLTEDEARAKGYIKGTEKVEEQIMALKRITTPTTVYKLQKLDRDDIIDITDFDVVAWMKDEMRMMLDEEIARAILFGDGRQPSSNDKINELCIRPVWTDEATYVINTVMNVNGMTLEQKAREFVDQCVRSRKDYKGAGTPTLYISPDLLVEVRLLKDGDGYRRYKTDQELADDLRVSEIVEVEIMNGLTRTVDGVERELGGIILNMNDYTVGATKGGEVTLFDDFDLNFNKYEYLIETRMCGALTTPFSAIVVEFIGTANAVVPTYKLANVKDNSNPQASGWYTYDPVNGYTLTSDTARDISKIYYVKGTNGSNGSNGSTGSNGATGSTGATGVTGN